MKKGILLLIIAFQIFEATAQELYPYTEPASNMPAKSMSVKVAAYLGRNPATFQQQKYIPEVMFGVNKNWMLHIATSFSNMHTVTLKWEGAYVYGKYRFFSRDAVHEHFRMTLFAMGGYSKNNLVINEINIFGEVTGIQSGLIATKLKNKAALSSSVSFIKAFGDKDKHHANGTNKALGYTLSAGYLLLPREYKSFNQLNLNLYTEFLGQKSFDNKTYFVDAAPAIQAIFNSNSKVSIGYRFQVRGNSVRYMPKGFMVSFEHTFFNALRRKRN